MSDTTNITDLVLEWGFHLWSDINYSEENHVWCPHAFLILKQNNKHCPSHGFDIFGLHT